MSGVFALSHLFGVLFAAAAAWSIRFEARRKSVLLWRLFLPAALVLLCSLAVLAGQSSRGRGIWVIALVLGLPVGSARAFWLRMRSDHAAGVVRLSRVGDGFWAAVAAGVFAVIDAFVTLRSPAGVPVSPLFAAGTAFCAGYLGGRALVTRTRARKALHLDMRRPK
jgi:hypothetical protein